MPASQKERRFAKKARQQIAAAGATPSPAGQSAPSSPSTCSSAGPFSWFVSPDAKYFVHLVHDRGGFAPAELAELMRRGYGDREKVLAIPVEERLGDDLARRIYTAAMWSFRTEKEKKGAGGNALEECYPGGFLCPPCLRCGLPTGNWCEGCDNGRRPVCNPCEAAGRFCGIGPRCQ